jgi:hypothetical protein
MKYHSSLWTIMGGLLAVGVQLAACSDDEPSPRTRSEFCTDWAEAACSSTTVMACQAADADACRLAQEEYCQDLVPATFSDARGSDCIDAVGAAYADADLTGTEIDTVRRLGGACGLIVTGSRAVGQSCDTDNDCDRSNGVECVRRGGFRGGICQVPDEVGPGQTCGEPTQTCTEGFFCDGSNCIASKAVGQTCQNDVECAPDGFCGPNDTCVARLSVGATCTFDNECESLFCYAVNADSTCADLIRLSPAEPLCDDLR